MLNGKPSAYVVSIQLMCRVSRAGERASYPVDLRLLQQKLHDLRVASSGCKVKRGAELAVEQVWIAVALLQ